MNWTMETFDGFEYTKKDLIGHGAFAIVYKGRYVDVSDFVYILFQFRWCFILQLNSFVLVRWVFVACSCSIGGLFGCVD